MFHLITRIRSVSSNQLWERRYREIEPRSQAAILSERDRAEIEDEECSRLLEEDAQLVWGAVGTTKGGVGGLHLGVVEFGVAK